MRFGVLELRRAFMGEGHLWGGVESPVASSMSSTCMFLQPGKGGVIDCWPRLRFDWVIRPTAALET